PQRRSAQKTIPKTRETPYHSCPQSLPKKRTYRVCFGPWNISEGQDPYGPPVRPPQAFDWKLAQLKKLGFDAMMFHDDDAVPDIDSKSESQIRKETKELRKKLDGEGIAAEMDAHRLW